MNAQETLVFESEVSVAVLGRAGSFVLVPLTGEIESAMAEARAKGWYYCGVLGFKDGQAQVECEPDPDCIYTMMHAGLEFAHVIVQRIRAQQGDAVDWLERLHSMPDTRPNA